LPYKSGLYVLLFLLSISSVTVDGATRQQNSVDDSVAAPCCGFDIANSRTNNQHMGVSDAQSINSPGPSSFPPSIDRALDLTPDDVLEKAESTLNHFNSIRLGSDLFLGLDADVDDRVIHRFGLLVNSLSQLINKLRETAGASLTEQLRYQAENIRKDALRLLTAAHNLGLLVQAKDRCGLHHLGIFLSTVETLSLELSTLRSDPASPDLHYFFFENQLPNVVPPEGGWLILAGSELWEHDRPQVTLVDQDDERTVAVLEVRQTDDDTMAAVKIEPDLIASNSGSCLSLRAGHNLINDMHRRKQPGTATYDDLPI
jgi:hypothetical protein